MTNLDLYPVHDQAYLLAHHAARETLKKGEIKAFSVSRAQDHGRMIHVESDQGWDPHPFFQEFEDERAFAPPPN